MKPHTPLFLIALLSLTALTSCVTSTPKAATSKHANAISAGYSVNDATKELYGMITFQILDLEKGKYTAVITFENPESPEEPFQSIQEIDENTKWIFMRTPDLKILQQNKKYTATLTLHQGDKNGEVISQLKQPVLVTVSPGMAEELGVTTKIQTSRSERTETSKENDVEEVSKTKATTKTEATTKAEN